MFRKTLMLCTAAGFAACLTSSASGDISVRFEAPDVTVGLGDVFTMDIVADIDEPVLGWGLDLTIDNPSIVSTVGLPVIDSAWFAAPFNPDGDGLAALAFPDSIVGTNLLATVTFSADMLGETDLFLSADVADLTEGFPLDNEGFGSLTFQLGHVSVVPVPAAVMLGIVGLAMIAATRRFFREPTNL